MSSESQEGDVGGGIGSMSPGARLGPYVIESLLGQGGMGEVYSARHEALDQVFALKVIGADIVSDQEARDRFVKEARESFRLRHPGIVRVDHFDEAGGQPYLRMELMGGVTLPEGGVALSLEDWLHARGGGVSLDEALPILRDVLAGLAYAHGRGVIHRDIKPANILLYEEGGAIRAKLGDFGLVKAVGEDFIQSRIRLSVSKSRVVLRGERTGGASSGPGVGSLDSRELSYIGTYDYMAPEQRDGLEATVQSDLYAVGLVAYRMLTGQKVVGFKRPSELARGLDSAWDGWIARTMDTDPLERFTDAATALESLPGADGSSSGGQVKGRALTFAALLTVSIALGAGAWHWRGDLGLVEGSGAVAPLASNPPSELIQAPAALLGDLSLTSEPTGVAFTLRSLDDGLEVHSGKTPSRLEGLPVGGYEAVFEKTNYRAARQEIQLVAGTLMELSARFEPVVVRLSSDPTGALVLEGDRRLGRTPLELMVEPGMVDYRLELAGYETATVSGNAREGEALSLRARLEKYKPTGFGSLIVKTEPAGARVALGGDHWETSPAVFRDVAAGDYTLRVSKEHYEPLEQTVTVEADRFGELALLELERARGTLAVLSEPAGASFTAKLLSPPGDVLERSGKSPASLPDLPTGDYEVSFRYGDFPAQLKRVAVNAGVSATAEALFRPGKVVVTSAPSGAEVYVDRVLKGTTPLHLELAPGERTFDCRLEGHEGKSRREVVRGGQELEVSLSLDEIKEPQPGQPWALDLPGGGGSLAMVWIDPGTFMMGSPSSESGRDDDERQHRVTLTDGYWLGSTEVTQGQWAALMGSNPSHFKSSGSSAPVEHVSWNEAMDFCREVTERERAAGRLPPGYEYSLPTEAQWEYACRAGTTGPYGGSSLGDLGWYNGNSGGKTHSVGQTQSNAWGLYDMHGNVWEWCYDRYGGYPPGSVTDPMGAASGSNRVDRGGGWNNRAQYCRSANRYGGTPSSRSSSLGFRLALRPVQ